MQRYVERIDELLKDGYLINNRTSDVRLTSKGVAQLHNLIHQGFLVMAKHEDNARLTQKGLAVLQACADRPIKPRHIKYIPIQRK